MIYSSKLSIKLLAQILINKWQKKDKFPFALMLEPTFACNFNCLGCGKIIEYADSFDRRLTVEQCLQAVKEADAPIVSITGGEPLLHPEIGEIVQEIVNTDYLVMLCTNGFFLSEFLDRTRPHANLNIVVHLDGPAASHEAITRKKGAFEKAISAIEKGVEMGFSMKTNTTVYNKSDPEEIIGLFHLLQHMGVDGIMVSPAFNFTQAQDNLILKKEESHLVFSRIHAGVKGVRLYNTPLYWDYLMGKRELQCNPWANPTYNVKGWKSPCYMITDRYYRSFTEMMEKTDWQAYGPDKDARCQECMMHAGFETSAFLSNKNSVTAMFRLFKWNMTGQF